VIATVLMCLSAAIPFALGALHFAYTFSGPKLLPRDLTVRDAMSRTPLVITRETTVWRAWLGFNASHGMGAMLFGLIYGYLAAAHPALLFRSPFLLLVGLAMLGGLLVLAKRYWFSVPLRGVVVSLALYVASVVASMR
jgi:hypothetical protein